MKDSKDADQAPADITRRDFLNGLLIAGGTLAVSSSFPLKAFAKMANSCGDGLFDDPRAARGGNLPSAFRVGHWMRDRRLTFSKDVVELKSGCDGSAGRHAIVDDPQKFDLIVVGGGISGLSTALFLSKRNPNAKILILDSGELPGGNSGRDDSTPLPFPCATGGSYGVAPYADFQKELYSTVGFHWEKYKISQPMYSYYFDEHTPGVKKGHRGWNLDTYGKGLKDAPFEPKIVEQLIRCRKQFTDWSKQEGSPTDPADQSNPRHDSLSTISLDQYLRTDLGCDPVVSDFYTAYTVDALGGTAKDVNAHSSISFIGAEYGDLFAFPGGNSGLARFIVKNLIPEAIAGTSDKDLLGNPILPAKLDLKSNRVRLRQQAVAVRADPDGSVLYFKDGKFVRAYAQAVVLAGQAHTSQHLVEHLVTDGRKAAWRKTHNVPVIVANVLVRNRRPFVESGFGYNQYWWGSKYWADYVMADWASGTDPKKIDTPAVLTFFGGNWAGPNELPGERMKLMTTPFRDYEKSIKEDLSRIMTGKGFDFDRDVQGIFLYRWGHGMIMPTPGTIFGDVNGGKIERSHGPRHICREPIGRISFAGQETEGTPSIESAMASGLRAAGEALRARVEK